MSFIGRLFGSDKATEKLVDNISSGIDKIWYTDEEKADDLAQARREGQEVFMKWLESTSGSRLARRTIALLVTVPWALEHMSSVILKVVAIFADKGEKFLEAAKVLGESATENNALVGVVLLFYFGGPAAVDGVKGLVQKWVNRRDKQ